MAEEQIGSFPLPHSFFHVEYTAQLVLISKGVQGAEATGRELEAEG